MVTTIHRHTCSAAAVTLVLLFVPAGQGQPSRGAAAPEYQRVRGLTGQFTCAVSPAVRTLVDRWKKDFQRMYPAVSLKVVRVESSSVPSALLAGTCDLAAMGRRITDGEEASFRTRFGHAPESFSVAADGIAVIVKKDNPIGSGLTLRQLDGIFSAATLRGGPVIETWGDIGVTGDWADTPVVPMSPGPAAGERALFQSIVLKGSRFRSDVRQQRTSSSVVQGVGLDPGAIGFASSLYPRGPRVRALPLSSSNGDRNGPYVAMTRKTCLDGSYPLCRFTYIYVNRTPGSELNPLTAEFLRFVNSRQGQRTAEDAGYYRLSPDLLAAQQRRLAGG